MKNMKKRIAAVALALVMVVAFSATAFAEGPQGGPNQGTEMGSAPQGGMRMNGQPKDNFNQNGQQPPEKPEGEDDMTPPDDGKAPMDDKAGRPGGMDPMNQILTAVSELEDDSVRENLEALLQAQLEAIEAERTAADEEARAAAAEAVAAAQDALNAALAEAGIEVNMDAPMDGQEPPEKPEGDEDRTPPADGQRPPEKPEGEDDMTPPEAPAENETRSADDQGMFRLFRQFLEWLKGSSED